MRKTLVFDLDGTLLNTLGDLRDSTNYALKKFGYPERTTEEIRNFVGNGLKMLIVRALPKDSPDVEAVLAEMKRHYVRNCANLTRPYDGIPEMLAKLSGAGFRLAIVSNKAAPMVSLLREHYFSDLIPVAVGESEAIARKPAPDMVFEALRQLGSAQEDAVYIGDSDVDILTAKNSGIPCRSVCWGFRSEEELCRSGAKTVYRTPEELYRALTADG